MVRKVLFISIIIIIVASSIGLVPRIGEAQASSVPVEETARQHVLKATVQITLYNERQNDETSETQYTAADGLGTLVKDGANTYLVTHDHWSRLVGKMKKAEIRNAEGDLLLALDRKRFYSLIRYRDGSTMVMVAPEELTAELIAVPVAKGQAPSVGQELLIAYWQPAAEEKIAVEPVTVELNEVYKEQPAMRLKSLNGQVVVQGNSGGGVFANGHLIGNIWETLVRVQLENGEVTGETDSTDLSRAAQLVYEIDEQPTGQDAAVGNGPNRGEI